MRRQLKDAPILFFNEGDSVFSSRAEMRGNSSQTENTVQTILLQELEVFDGILIITTNRPDSFDPAFQRRILLHIEIQDPIDIVRFDLLRHLFPNLREAEAQRLSANFTFTGAQLGVFKKQWELRKIVKDRKESEYEALESYLKSLQKKVDRKIGFAA
jgi:SpoVK/Ycf46/Vps4 family AAA+-type ATPase